MNKIEKIYCTDPYNVIIVVYFFVKYCDSYVNKFAKFFVWGAGFIGSTLTKRLLADEKCEKMATYLPNVEYRSNDWDDPFKGDI